MDDTHASTTTDAGRAHEGPVIERLAMTTYVVSDQDAAIEYYTGKLGFAITRDHPGPQGRFVAVAPREDRGVELVLVEPAGFPEARAEQLRGQVGTGWGTVYLVDDCETTYEALRARGVRFRGEPETTDWGTQVVVVDPDGNELVLQERPPGSR